MYECLAGRVPFHADNVTDLLRRIIKEEPQPLSAFTSASDPQVDEIVQKAVSRFRDQRYATARAFGRAMRPIVGERLSVEKALARSLKVAGNALPSGLKAVSSVNAA
jgi:serine/threonine-protein kinase